MKKLIIILLLVLGCNLRGPQGPKGDTGPQGIQGAPGGNCTVQTIGTSSIAPAGGSLISCPDGSQSCILNGTSTGTLLSSVQLCPNEGATTYPSHFPEYGFCLNNVLYGVYWDSAAPNAWLAELVPGTYMSTSTGLGCTFIVESNCQVVQQ